MRVVILEATKESISMKNNKKNKNKNMVNKNDEMVFDLSGSLDTSTLNKGTRVLKDVFAPSRISQPTPDHIVVGNKYVRSYSLQGYPLNVHIK